MLIKGTELNRSQREQVLNAFPYRWTSDNTRRLTVYNPCPNCDIKAPIVNLQTSEGHNHPTIPLITDDEWLNQYAFHFVKDGSRLMYNKLYAEKLY